MSTMVVADKYQLLEPVSQLAGTWNKAGGKKHLGRKIVPRSYVEDRNSHNNNELYIIDEAATVAMLEERERNIVENAEKRSKENVTMADLVGTVADALKGDKPKKTSGKAETVKTDEKIDAPVKDEGNSEEPSNTWSEQALRDYCDKQTPPIVYHHKAGKSKLLELISNQK